MSSSDGVVDVASEKIQLSDLQTRSTILKQPLTKSLLGTAGVAVGLLAIKPFLSTFNLILSTQMLIFCLVAISLQLLWGKAGLDSFGQATFFGLGAYSYAIVSTRFGDPQYSGWVPILLSILIPLIVAALLGYFLFFGGVRGAYFTIVTLASVLIANQVVISWRGVTGGDTGLTGVPGLVLPFGLFTLDFTSRDGKYYLGVIAVILGLLVALAVKVSKFGLILEAIREDENRAKFLGYNTPWYLVGVLALSGGLAGLAGGIFAAATNLAAPNLVSIILSVEILTWVAVGGRRYLVGAIFGTVLMKYLEFRISDVLPNYWPLVIGLFFVVVVLLFPSGIFGTVSDLLRRRRVSTAKVKAARI